MWRIFAACASSAEFGILYARNDWFCVLFLFLSFIWIWRIYQEEF